MFRTNFHRIRSYSKHANIVCKRHNSSRVNSFIERWKQNTIPVWAGLSVIGIVQYLKIRKRHEDEINLALEEGRLQKVDVDVSFKVRLYNSVPLESLSRFVGDLGRREIPKWARSHLLSIYCSCYGVNMDEALISGNYFLEFGSIFFVQNTYVIHKTLSLCILYYTHFPQCM